MQKKRLLLLCQLDFCWVSNFSNFWPSYSSKFLDLNDTLCFKIQYFKIQYFDINLGFFGNK